VAFPTWTKAQEDFLKLIEQRQREQERAIKEAQEAADKAKREAREVTGLQINKWLLYANFGLFATALLTGAASLWQASETRKARIEAQANFTTTRNDAAASAEQARQDTLGQFKQQLDAQHALRDQAAHSATAASAAAFAAKAQTEIMGKQMTLAQQIERPWVGIDGDIVPRWQTPEIPKVPGGPILSVLASVKLQNFGQSVASRVQAQFKLDDSPVSLMGREAHWRQAAKPLCDEAERKSLDEHQTAVVIFPASSTPFEPGFGFVLGEYSSIHVVLALGCIVYRDQAGTIHHTRTLYQAEFRETKQIPATPFFYQEIARFTPLDVDAD